MKKLVTLLGLISLVSLQAESLSLKDCLAISRKNNPDYQISQYRVKSAKNSYLSSYSPFIPGLQTSFSYSHTKSKTNRIDTQTGVLGGITEYDYYSGTLSSGITLFDIGDFYQVRSSKAYYNSIQYSHQQNELDLTLDITTQYFNTLAYKKLTDASIDNINRTQKQLDKIQQMFQLGIVSQIDVIKQQGLLGKARLDSITNVKSYQIALGKLNEIMGRSPDDPLVLQDMMDTTYVQPNYFDLITYAQEHHPGLKYYQQNTRYSKFQMYSTFSRYMPSISLGFSHGWGNNDFDRINDFFNTDYRQTIGVSMNWTIFDGFNRELSMKNKKIDYQIAKETQTKTELSLIQSIKSAYLSLTESQEKIRVSQINYETALKEHQLAEEKYTLGAGAFLDLLDAQVNLINSQITLITNLYNYRISMAILENTSSYQIQIRP